MAKTRKANGFNPASVNKNVSKSYGTIKRSRNSPNGSAAIKSEVKRLANKKL